MTSRRQRVASKSKELTKQTIFGPPPILEGEDGHAYYQLLAQFSRAMTEGDIVEKIWARDLTDLTWEIFRLRSLEARIVSDQIPQCLEDILTKCLSRHAPEESWREDSPAGKKLARKWALGDPAAIERIHKILRSKKLTMESVRARAFEENLDSIERIERLIAEREERRNSILREIDRRRKPCAERFRSQIHEIEDAEFESIAPEIASGGQTP
jgi:hypothetical protein